MIDSNKSVIIFSHPRSGSTWFQDGFSQYNLSELFNIYLKYTINNGIHFSYSPAYCGNTDKNIELHNRFEIYNGHPGLITQYPELKGKDPQQKAFDLGLESSGCVIHRVTEGVDEGEILRSRKVSIKGLEIGELFHILHSISVSLWVDFLKN